MPLLTALSNGCNSSDDICTYLFFTRAPNFYVITGLEGPSGSKVIDTQLIPVKYLPFTTLIIRFAEQRNCQWSVVLAAKNIGFDSKICYLVSKQYGCLVLCRSCMPFTSH